MGIRDTWDVRDALEIVEVAKETAEKVIKRANKIDFDIGDCEDIEDKHNGTIYFHFVSPTNCGYSHHYAMTIPVDVLNNPTEERIGKFVDISNKAKAEEEAQQVAMEKQAAEEAAAEDKKKRFKTYQELKEEFSLKGE